MWNAKGKTATVGVGYSELSRRSEKLLGLLALDGCRAALADAGVRPERVDGLATFPEVPFLGAGHRDGQDIVSVEYLMNHLPLASADNRPPGPPRDTPLPDRVLRMRSDMGGMKA